MSNNKARTAQASLGQFKRWEQPKEFDPCYREADREGVGKIIDWLNANQRSLTWISAAAHVNRSTLSTVLKGSYPSAPSNWVRKVLATIESLESRSNVHETPFTPSSVTNLVWAACKRANKYKGFAVVTAEVGTGKTRALKEYVASHPNTILIEADPIMSPTVLMDDLMEALQIDCGKGYKSKERRYRLALDEFKRRDALLILDEAETVNDNTLHYIRRLRDKADIGVVLSGTPKLGSLIYRVGGTFDQIRSRVCFQPKPIRSITKDDAVAVILASFSDLPTEPDAATIKALWHHCRGSMRVLVESLIPALRDYGLKKHALSAELVHAVATDILSLDV